MTIDIEVKDGIKILHPRGQLGGDEGLTLVEEINEILSGVGDCAIVDLADVPTINSAGIGAVVRIQAQANTQEQSVVFASPAPFVAGVFATSRLDHFLRIFSSVDEAVQTLRK